MDDPWLRGQSFYRGGHSGVVCQESPEPRDSQVLHFHCEQNVPSAFVNAFNHRQPPTQVVKG